jgi:hypothetical protein
MSEKEAHLVVIDDQGRRAMSDFKTRLADRSTGNGHRP